MGRVSVRMLRHYDSIGLLRPARVDRFTGYRYYEAEQLKRLNRLVGLKELGFSLADVARIADDKVNATELRGMLQLRRVQLADQVSADTDRLVRIEARLRMIEREGAMSTRDVTTKALAPVHVATVGGVAESNNQEDIGPVMQSLSASCSAHSDGSSSTRPDQQSPPTFRRAETGSPSTPPARWPTTRPSTPTLLN